MKLIRVAIRPGNMGFYFRQFNRSLSALPNISESNDGFGTNDNQNTNYTKSTYDFSDRIFGGVSEDTSNSFYRSLDRIEKARFGPDMGFPGGNSSGLFDEEGDSITTLTDGMEGKLKQQASYFDVDPQEMASDNYAYRTDINLKPRMTYTTEDLNIRKPGVYKPLKRLEFKVTTKEALENADFRNVRFLANFLTEGGIIIKRSMTGISAKAQRKVAREIKIARSFGLLPFTTMGTKAFVFGKTMENLDQDYEVYPYDIQADDDVDPIAK